MTAIRRLSEHRSELLEEQPENGLALALGPAQALSVVVEDGTGGATFEAAPRTVIEIVGGDFHRQSKIFWRSAMAFLPLIQGRFQITNAFFFRPVIAGKVRWIVQWQHAKPGHDGIHVLIVEGRTIVPFKEQRRAVLTEQAFEMSGYLAAVERRSLTSGWKR